MVQLKKEPSGGSLQSPDVIDHVGTVFHLRRIKSESVLGEGVLVEENGSRWLDQAAPLEQDIVLTGSVLVGELLGDSFEAHFGWIHLISLVHELPCLLYG